MDAILEKLNEIESSSTTIQFVLTGMTLVLLFISYRVLVTLSESKVKSIFKQSIASFKTDLNTTMGKELLKVQAELKKDIALVESKLNISSQLTGTSILEAKNDLTNLYISYSDWLNSIDPGKVEVSGSDHRERTTENLLLMDQFMKKFETSLFKAELSIEDDSFMKETYDLLVETKKVRSLISLRALEIGHIASSYEVGAPEGDDKSSGVVLKKVDELLSKLHSDFIEQFRSLIDRKTVLRKAIQVKISDLNSQYISLLKEE